jgi:hypothetical protein
MFVHAKWEKASIIFMAPLKILAKAKLYTISYSWSMLLSSWYPYLAVTQQYWYVNWLNNIVPQDDLQGNDRAITI